MNPRDNSGMQINWQETWGPRLAAFVLAALVAASASYWGLRWSSVSAGEAGRAVAVAGMGDAPVTLDANALARLLGGSPSVDAGGAGAGPGSSRWQLIGVVAGPAGRGAAVIAEEDQPAKAYQVGSRVAEGLVLQSVAPRRAMLGVSAQGPATVTLELKASAPNEAGSMGLVMNAPAPEAR